MRVAQNPMRRWRRGRPPARITVVRVTHIPFLAGYYAQSLDVLKLMLASLYENTEEEFDLHIFDNASCAEVRESLLQQNQDGYVQSLTLCAENVGILWERMFSVAPGDYIAYVDSDIYFHPRWLTESLRVLETFPNAGLVTAMPARHSSTSFTRHTLEWARSALDVGLDEGNLLRPDWIADYCDGFGLDLEQYLTRWAGQNDYRLTYRGVGAYAGASSNQFLGRKSVLEAAAPPRPNEWVMHQSGTLFERLDAAGYLMLATDGPYVHHLGNVLTENWRSEADKLGLTPASKDLSRRQDWWSSLARSGLARRALLKLYDRLFQLLYRGVA